MQPGDLVDQERSQDAPPKSSLLGGFAKMAATMLGYGLGLKVFRGVGFRANVGLGKLAVSLTNKGSTARKLLDTFGSRVSADALINTASKERAVAFLSKITQWAETPLARINTSMAAAVEGDFASQRFFVAGGVKNATKWMNKLQNGSNYKRSVSIDLPADVGGAAVKDIRFTTLLSKTDWFMKNNGLRALQEAKNSHLLKKTGDLFAPLSAAGRRTARFGGPDSGQAFLGRAVRYAVDLATYAPMDYAFFRTMANDDKKWYDPSAIKEWAGWTIGADVVFRGMGPLGRMALAGGKAFGKSVLGNVPQQDLRRIGTTTFDLLQKVNDNRFFTAVVGTHRTMQAAGKATPALRDIPKYISEFTAEVRRVWHDNDTLKRYRKENNETVTETAARQAQEAYRNSKFRGYERDNALKTAQLKELYRVSGTQRQRIHFHKLNKLFGAGTFKRKGLDDETVNHLVETFGADTRSQIQALSSGPGSFTFAGTDYNLTNLLPTNLLAKAGKLITGFPRIFGVPIFGVLGASPLFLTTQERTYFRRYGEGRIQGYGVPVNNYEEMVNNALAAGIAGKPKPLSAETHPVVSPDDIRYFNEQMQTQNRVMEGNRRFIEQVAKLRANRQSDKDKSRIVDDIQRGRAYIAPGEELHFMGNKMFHYSTDINTGKTDVLQYGYDPKTGSYHGLTAIDKNHGGGMLSLMKQWFGKGGFKSYTNGEFQTHDSENAAMLHTGNTSLSDPAARKGKNIIMDILELGDKEQQTTLGKIASSFFKFGDPFNLRVLAGKVFSQTPQPITRTEQLYLGEKMEAILNINDLMITKRVLNDKSDIDGIATAIKGVIAADRPLTMDIDSLRSMEIGFEPGKGLNVFSSQFKTNVQNFIQTSGRERMQQTLGREAGDMMYELANIIVHGDASAVTAKLSKQYGQYKDIRLNYKEAWNGMLGKMMFQDLNNQQTARVIESLTNNAAVLSRKNDFEMLAGIHARRFFRDMDPENGIGDKDDLVAQVQQLQDFANTAEGASMRKSIMLTIDKMESWISPNMHRTDIQYPSARTGGMDLIYSTGKDASSGKTIVSFMEGLFPSMKTGGSWLSTVLSDSKSVSYAPNSALTGPGLGMMQALNAINNVGGTLGLGFEQMTVTDPGIFFGKLLFKRAIPAVGLMTGWGAADAFFDNSGLFEQSILGDGLNVLAGDIAMRTRLGIARFNDTTGITDAAAYLEGLMPGSVTSPLMGAARGFAAPILSTQIGFKTGGLTGGITGGIIGGAISLLTAGGPLATMNQFDVTKRREELIEQYSGREDVPHMKSANWLFSLTPIEGQKIERFEAHPYHQLRSQYQYTPVLYGNKFERLFNMFNPYHYGDQHAITRPYPVSNAFLSDLPLIGDAIGLGAKTASQEDLQYMDAYLQMGGDRSFAPSVSIQGTSSSMGAMTVGMMGQTGGTPSDPLLNNTPYGSSQTPGFGQVSMSMNPTGGSANMISPYSAPARLKQLAQSAGDLFGYRGFLADTMFQNMNSGLTPFEHMPQYQSASRMTSFGRTYWELELGDLLAQNEFLRRIVPKYGQHINSVNAMVNVAPNWLPGDDGFINFQKGDMFQKIKKGEMRLPGSGYDALRNVSYNVPLETEFLGMSYGEQVGLLTGTRLPASPDFKMDRAIKSRLKRDLHKQLSQTNFKLKMDVPYFDAGLDMAGKADFVTNNGIIQVKPVSNETFRQLSGPREQDYGEMNALLHMSQMFNGTIMYVNGETGETKNINVTPDPGRYQADVQQLVAARARSISMIREKGPKISNALGNAYSRLDRLRILADVSPYSQEFKTTLSQVRALKKMGKLSAEEEQMLEVILAQREATMDRYKFTDYRFLRGTAVTEEEAMLQDQIADAYNPLERAVGGAWETIVHKQTLWGDKGINVASPIEQYKRNEVFGRTMRDWAAPYRDFVRPMATSAFNQEGALQSALSLGTGAFAVIGGAPGSTSSLAAGIAGASFGALYGAMHEPDVPAYIQKERDMIATLDKIEYVKAQQAYEAGDPSAYERMQKTMTYAYDHMDENPALMLSAVPKAERGFMRAFTKAGTLEERREIMKYAPDYVKPFLEKAWSAGSDINNPMDDVGTPGPQWSGWDPSLTASDIGIAVMEEAGFSAHDINMGWQNERRRMALMDKQAPTSFGKLVPDVDKENVGRVVSALQGTLPGARASGTFSYGDTITINVRLE